MSIPKSSIVAVVVTAAIAGPTAAASACVPFEQAYRQVNVAKSVRQTARVHADAQRPAQLRLPT